MTTLIRGTKSYFMGTQAYLLDDEHVRDTASSWATKYVKPNPAIKWILGRYVEANSPNNNRQAWALEDLRMSQPTIDHGPMNMVHQARNIVGSFVANEMIYPTEDNADDGLSNPFVETLGAFWKYYFPEEYQAVQKAHDEGALFFSMECVAKNMIFEDPSTGRKQEFPYAGPFSDSYGEWNQDRAAIRWLDKPHFLGGALILPPVKPGWSDAEVKTLSHYVEQHQDVAEHLYDEVKQQAPHLSSEQIEQITVGLMKGQITEEMANLVENSNKIRDWPINSTDTTSSDESASGVSPEGGDKSTMTYTEQELNDKVAEAVASIKAEVDQLKAQADADAVEARISEITAEHDEKLNEVQLALDNAVLEAQTAKDALSNTVAYLEAEKQATEEAAERAEKADERLAAIKEVANFPEEFVTAQTERWTNMSDDEFDATVAGYKVVAEAAKAAKVDEGDDTLSKTAATAMKAERDETGKTDKMSGIRDIMRGSLQGQFDPRTI